MVFMEIGDRVVGGIEPKSKIISPIAWEFVAYYEVGDAVSSWYLKHLDFSVAVSNIPNGKSLGSTWYGPAERHNVAKSQFIDQIRASLGSRAAEEIIFGGPS